MSTHYDIVILGGGAAGLMCAAQAGARARKVLVVEHGPKLGRKILISGGGRCNFTNIGSAPQNFVSENEHFCKSALSRFTPQDFMKLVQKYKIPYYEKKLGQFFCKTSAKEIVSLLENECQETQNVDISLNTHIKKVSRNSSDSGFLVETSNGTFEAKSLVVATGGLSIPQIGATSLGYDIAKQFGLKVTKLEPALDGFSFVGSTLEFCKKLSGVSLDVEMSVNKISFRENLLFTHKGLSGPAALQTSLYWRRGDEIRIKLCPDLDLLEFLINEKKQANKALLKNILAPFWTQRFADQLAETFVPELLLPLNQLSDKALMQTAQTLQNWSLKPVSTVGYAKAEVTRGGIDTQELSSKTFEAKKCSGLYFIGEVVDVTGWLGGYNFQWAWASAWCAGQVV
jgi:predicted Rossmann fold flavoprotein